MNEAQFEKFMSAQQQMMIAMFKQLSDQQTAQQQAGSSAMDSAAALAASLDSRIGKFGYDPEAGFTFEHWFKRYGKFIEEDGKDLEEAAKVRLLVSKLADPEYAQFADSILPKLPDELNFADAVKRLKELFGDTRSLFFRRFECFKLKQSAHQDAASFLAQVNAACENADLTLTKETLKCLIMVMGLRDDHHDLRQRCLQLLEEARKRNEELTLEKLGEECRAFQLIRESAISLARSEGPKFANAVHTYPQQWRDKQSAKEKARKPETKDDHSVNSEGSDQDCLACGNAGHSRRNCRHRKARCFQCNQQGHIRSACPELKGKGRKEKPRVSHAVDTVAADAFCLATDAENSDWWKVPVQVNGIDVEMKIDSGAQVAMLTMDTWQKLLKPKLGKAKVNVRDCNGKCVEIRGQLECIVKMGEKQPKKLTALVNDGIRHDLLGIPWIRALNILPGTDWTQAPMREGLSRKSPEKSVGIIQQGRGNAERNGNFYCDPALHNGDAVRVLNFRGRKVCWLPGTIVGSTGKATFQVRVPSLKTVIMRKPQHIRVDGASAANSNFVSHNSESSVEPDQFKWIDPGYSYEKDKSGSDQEAKCLGKDQT